MRDITVFANHLSASINLSYPENCYCNCEIIFLSYYMRHFRAIAEMLSRKQARAKTRLHASGDTRRLLCTNRHKSGDLVVANVSLVSESHVRFFFFKIPLHRRKLTTLVNNLSEISRDSRTSMIRSLRSI